MEYEINWKANAAKHHIFCNSIFCVIPSSPLQLPIAAATAPAKALTSVPGREECRVGQSTCREESRCIGVANLGHRGHHATLVQAVASSRRVRCEFRMHQFRVQAFAQSSSSGFRVSSQTRVATGVYHRSEHCVALVINEGPLYPIPVAQS